MYSNGDLNWKGFGGGISIILLQGSDVLIYRKLDFGVTSNVEEFVTGIIGMVAT